MSEQKKIENYFDKLSDEEAKKPIFINNFSEESLKIIEKIIKS